jgi:drug/metabolite transporter (DMT)-like permease
MSTKRRWLTNRRLFILEALLCVGALETWAENALVARPDLIDPFKVLIIMALVLGMFSAVTGLVEWHIQASLKKVQTGKKKLPLAVPDWLLHVAIFVGLYFFYAWVNNLRWYPPS